MDDGVTLKPTVFISHAAEDKRAVDFLTELILREGDGRIDVFCTSSPGHGISSGTRFFEYIKEVLGRSALVVHFISPAFLQSAFCMLELGAAWAQGKSFALRVPTLKEEEVRGTVLASLQLAPLDPGDGLDELRDKIDDLFQLRLRTTGWAGRRDRAVQSMIGALPRSPITRLASVGVREHHLEAWALNVGGRVIHSWWPDDNGAKIWNKPYDFGAPGGIVDLAAVSRGPDHCEVFAVDNENVVWHRRWDRIDGWYGWHRFRDQRVAPPISACSYQDGQIELFALDPDTGRIIHAWSWKAGEWGGWALIGDFEPT